MWSAVERALNRAKDSALAAGKAWPRMADAAHVAQALQAGRHKWVAYQGYLIVFDVGSPWYAPDALVLQEMLVLRYEDGPGNFRHVIAMLQALAEENGCVGISAGTALTTDPRLTRVYQRLGFQVEAQSLFRSM